MGSIKVTRLLHAGYIFEDESSSIIFDPIFENPFSINCYAYPSLEFDVAEIKKLKFSAIFISHFHDDHCSFESLNLLNKQTPIYIYCLNLEMLKLLEELGFSHVFALELGQSVKIGNLTVTPHRALDEEVDCIFQISNSEVNILNVVDAWIDYDKVKELSTVKWHLVLWPFQTMRELEVLSPKRFAKFNTDLPFEWVDQLKQLNPLNLVPSSCQFINEEWSWYNNAYYPISYKSFLEIMKVELPKTEIFKMNSGSVLSLKSEKLDWHNSLNWIKLTSSVDVDYDYQPNKEVPSTAEVAKNFQALSEVQKQQVSVYCNKSILEKLNNLDFSHEPYFQTENFLWRLKVYESSGSKVNIYDYIKVESRFKLLNSPANHDAVCWLTEVVDFKLWSGLYNSEAMTSLYLRINDVNLSAIYEKNIKEVSLTEDPLIRLLYDDSFASYQKKQLEKIRTTVSF